MKSQSLPLDLIDLENHGRKTLDSAMLKKSIVEEGQIIPLVVEGPLPNGRYILVEGYRRFHNLMDTGAVSADCVIQAPTSHIGRLKKRVKQEYLSRKKTGYERERLLTTLCASGLHRQEIAKETGIPLPFINKYLKSIGIPSDLKLKAEEARAGQDGLAKLYSNEKIDPELRLRLIARYIAKDRRRKKTGILSYHVDAIDTIAKSRMFSALNRASQEYCIDEAISNARFTKDMAQKIVNRELMNFPELYDKECHDSVYEELMSKIEDIISACTSLFLDTLSGEERKTMHRLVNRLMRATKTPLIWDPFDR